MATDRQLRAEPWWQREIVTPELDWFGSQLCAGLGVSRNHFGAKGDYAHLNGGHRSQEWVLNSRYCTSRTYAIEGGLTADQSRHIAAFDITPGTRAQMLRISQNLDRVVRAGRLEELVEWYGNTDGDSRVDGWNNIRDVVARSDASHLWHLHGRFGRRYLRDRSVMQRTLNALLHGTLPTPAADPVAARPNGDDMPVLMRLSTAPPVFLTNGVTARWVKTPDEVADFATLHNVGALPLGNNGQVQVVTRRALLGVILGDVPSGFTSNP
jgi:hypothetical protein